MVQPRFTRAEYWVLELVVVGSWPLTYLDAGNIEEIFNKPGHGLDHATLVDTLEGMFAAGLIEAGIWPGDTPAGLLSRAGIEAALAEPTPFGSRSYTFYQLTAEGCSQWEAFARPDWTRYVCADLNHEAGKGSLTCTDRQWLKESLEWLSAVDPLVDRGSTDYNEVRPWQATYWKSLPGAHSVSFPYREPVSAPPPQNQSLPVGFSEVGLYALWDGWYRWR